MEKYNRLIQLFLQLNPKPTDKQYHALADALGVDKEALEAAAYAMLSDCLDDKDGVVEVLASAEDELSTVQKVLNDSVDENYVPYYDSAATDGSRDASRDQLLQEVTYADGGFEPFDQAPSIDDGAPAPSLTDILGRLTNQTIHVAASPSLVKAGLKNVVAATETTDAAKNKLTTIQKGLRRALDMDFKFGEPLHLYYDAEDPTSEADEIISELEKEGHKFRVDGGTLSKKAFAVKTKDGLVLRRLNNHLSIFYSK